MRITYEKEKRLRVTFSAMQKNLGSLEGTVLQLMRHPQAGANQIMEVHATYARVWQSVQDVKGKLRRAGVRI